jgi:hypothetical protein
MDVAGAFDTAACSFTAVPARTVAVAGVTATETVGGAPLPPHAPKATASNGKVLLMPRIAVMMGIGQRRRGYFGSGLSSSRNRAINPAQWHRS